MSYVTIRKFAYLKTPKYTYVIHNDQGGTVSNCGMQPSMKATAKHLYNERIAECADNPQLRVLVETWHGFDAQDHPVMTVEFTDLDAFLSRNGANR
jgi:hypothetical protein